MNKARIFSSSPSLLSSCITIKPAHSHKVFIHVTSIIPGEKDSETSPD